MHNWVYGFHQHDFSQTVRLGGFRPTVFMEHGLAVGMWMTAASLSGLWLWWTGQWRDVSLTPSGRFRLPAWFVLLPSLVTTVLVKSSGALVLGAVGLAVLVAARYTRVPVFAAVLLAAAPLYAFVRTERSWDGQEVVNFIAENFDADRAASFGFRLRNEDMLVQKALERPVIGWGGFGRSRVYDDAGNDISVSDGLWVIALGERGFVGLVSLGLVLLLPPARYLGRFGGRGWTDRSLAAAAVMATLLGLYALDSVMNAMINPVFLLMAGGLIALRRLPTPAAPPTAFPSRVRPLAVPAAQALAWGR